MKPDPENITVILNLPVPKTVHMIKSVLGAAGYYVSMYKILLATRPLCRTHKEKYSF